MSIKKIISYYQDCYKQEFRDSSILNYLGTKVGQKIYFDNLVKVYQEGEVIFDQKIRNDLYKYLEIHQKEKTLIASSFFITGKMSFLGKKQTICAPLISVPVSLEVNKEKSYYFKYNFEESSCNTTLLNLIKNNYNLGDDFVLEIEELVNSMGTKLQSIHLVANKMKSYLDIDISDIEKLPLLVSDIELKKEARKEKLKISPSFSVGVIEKSKSSRGVLNELQEIKASNLYNNTLRSLFSGNRLDSDISIDKKATIYVPSNLSSAQLDVIYGTRASDVTVVIGPPGTGKSYTIASMAIDMVYHNKSVLICSKSDQAVNVLQDKIVHDLGVKGLSIRAGVGRSFKSVLKKKIESILHFKKYKTTQLDVDAKKEKINAVQKRIEEIEEEIKEREQSELKKGGFLAKDKFSFFQKIKKKYISYKVLKELPFWLLITLLKDEIHKKSQLIKSLIALQYKYKIVSLLKEKRSVFQDLLSLIKSRDLKKREHLFASIDFNMVLECLPIWITKSADISTVLPLQNDMFDVAIIDEASQCDIATMIPILARAKKIVVVGDPKQLRHVSFLSVETLNKTANDYGLTHGKEILNYRTHSFLDYLLDRIGSQNNIHFLDEHYRSTPSIIKYSNERFYNGNLKVMSDFKINEEASSVSWVKSNGKKTKKGVNLIEANQLLKDIESLIEKEKKLPATMCSSIGVLSPFRDQVDFLTKKIEEFDLLYIKKHKIIVGTPYSFQGEERDVMFISFTIDDETSGSVFQYLDREDVFNVSITRAKHQQFLYHSFSPKNFKNKHLLIDYFSNSQIFDGTHTNIDFTDRFAKEVYNELVSLGVNKKDILINHMLAGYVLDVITTHNNRVLCIDLVGYPGELEKTFSIDQYRTMFRTKVDIIVIPYGYWLLNKQACIMEIDDKLRDKS